MVILQKENESYAIYTRNLKTGESHLAYNNVLTVRDAIIVAFDIAETMNLRLVISSNTVSDVYDNLMGLIKNECKQDE